MDYTNVLQITINQSINIHHYFPRYYYYQIYRLGSLGLLICVWIDHYWCWNCNSCVVSKCNLYLWNTICSAKDKSIDPVSRSEGFPGSPACHTAVSNCTASLGWIIKKSYWLKRRAGIWHGAVHVASGEAMAEALPFLLILHIVGFSVVSCLDECNTVSMPDASTSSMFCIVICVC